MLHDGGIHRTYAHSVTELLAALMPGYTDATAAKADDLRLRHALDTQVHLQAQLCSAGELKSCTPADRELLVGSRATPPEIDEWHAPVPLVLIDTFYEPHQRRSLPSGNLLWLRPRDETSYLQSLHDIGIVTVAEHHEPH
jgi:hypothetical protein